MVDTNRDHEYKARMADLEIVFESVLSEHFYSAINLYGIGKLIAITPNYEINSLAALHLNEILDKKELYQLPPVKAPKGRYVNYSPWGFLFGDDLDYCTVSR